MNKLSFTCLFSLLVIFAWAQGPNNSGKYYQNADGKKAAELKTAFFNIIKNPDVVSYNGLIEAYHKTDTRPDGKVRDWYSNTTNYTWNDRNGNASEGAGWNREHSVPQSWFGEQSPMKSDIVHVFPTDCYVNGRRSNYPFGEVKNVTYQSNNGYCKLGSCKTEGYSGTVFEPNDDIKGDIARIYFYMVTCYEDRFTGWAKGAQDVFSSNKYEGLKPWCMNMMMRWSKQDPVDEVEIARNNAVKEVQGNRNPFVDYPGLEDYVWGSKMDVAFSYDHYEGGGDTIPPVERVDDPVFSPMAGTYYDAVHVTLACATTGASIYYTLDGTEPSISSKAYLASGFDLTETTTVKAIAYLDGMYSSTVSATYVIEQGDTIWTPDGEIALNSTFFDVNWNGSRPNSADTSISGTSNGITITYSIGSSANMFCNNEQIRLYGGNELEVKAANGEITRLEFVTIDSSKKLLVYENGDWNTLDGYIWTGKASRVTFGAASGSGHIKMSGVKVTMNTVNGIAEQMTITKQPVYYDLQGRRVLHPTKGLYIVNGRKVFLK